MTRRSLRSWTTVLAVAALPSTSVSAQTQPTPASLRAVPAETTAAAYVDSRWRAPRTSWGDPSFEGVWSTDDLRGVPMNRPPEQAGRESLTPEEFHARDEYGIRTFGYTSLVVDPPNGRMPALTPEGEALAASRTRGTFGAGPFDGFDDFSLYDRCITRGVLGSLLPVIYGNGLRITQNPSAVAISYEMIHDTRVVPLDGRASLDSGIPQLMGSARGHFEGDTLVVETTNFTNRTSLGVNGNGPPNSEKLKLTERFRRVDPEMIEYHATVDDPGAYTAPFTIRLMITSRPGYEVLEYSCHEGNGAVRNALSGERAYERQVAEAVAKGLPVPARAVEHEEIRNGSFEGRKVFNINAGE